MSKRSSCGRPYSNGLRQVSILFSKMSPPRHILTRGDVPSAAKEFHKTLIWGCVTNNCIMQILNIPPLLSKQKSTWGEALTGVRVNMLGVTSHSKSRPRTQVLFVSGATCAGQWYPMVYAFLPWSRAVFWYERSSVAVLLSSFGVTITAVLTPAARHMSSSTRPANGHRTGWLHEGSRRSDGTSHSFCSPLNIRRLFFND